MNWLNFSVWNGTLVFVCNTWTVFWYFSVSWIIRVSGNKPMATKEDTRRTHNNAISWWKWERKRCNHKVWIIYWRRQHRGESSKWLVVRHFHASLLWVTVFYLSLPTILNIIKINSYYSQNSYSQVLYKIVVLKNVEKFIEKEVESRVGCHFF